MLIKPTFRLVAKPEMLLPIDVDFTRTTTAYRSNKFGTLESKAAGALRHDYDPYTGEYLGWLLEYQSTNYLLNSEQTDLWTTTNVTVSASMTDAPDGTGTADSITDNATSGLHYVSQTVAYNSNQVWTYSVYVKAGTGRYVYLNIVDSTSNNYVRGSFDLQTQTTATATLGTGTGVSCQMTPCANGWYRLSVTGQPSTTSDSSVKAHLYMSGSLTGTTYSGTGSTVYAWGHMLELSTYRTSYIKTTTASASRSSDSIKWLTGSWTNDAEGTFVLEFKPFTNNAGEVFRHDDGTANNGRRIHVTQSTLAMSTFELIAGNSHNSGISSGPSINNGYVKVAYGYGSGSAIGAGNNVLAASNPYCASGLTEMHLGISGHGASTFSGWVRQFMYFPRKLSDSDIKSLST